MILHKEIYESNYIFYYEKQYLKLAKDIIDKNFKEIKKIKDTKRNFVSLIEIEGKKYIYKEPRNEYRIPQRQVMTLLKKGESLTTLVNINYLIEVGFKEFVKPLVAVNKRKNGMIIFSFFLMEYINGKEDRNYLDEIVNLMKKVHKYGYYHGDFNPGNFLIEDKKIRIIDTQGKRMKISNYRAHYDMITMKYDSYDDMSYPYSKNIFYYLAYVIKRVKRLPLIEKFGSIKKKLRDKGWKI